jgi:hypothetical protein
MNTIQEKIQDLNTTFSEFIQEKKLEGKINTEILELSKNYYETSLRPQLESIQNECELLGHIVEVINASDSLVLSENASTIQYCSNCRKKLG